MSCDHPVEQLSPRVAGACDNGPIGLRRKTIERQRLNSAQNVSAPYSGVSSCWATPRLRSVDLDGESAVDLIGEAARGGRPPHTGQHVHVEQLGDGAFEPVPLDDVASGLQHTGRRGWCAVQEIFDRDQQLCLG